MSHLLVPNFPPPQETQVRNSTAYPRVMDLQPVMLSVTIATGASVPVFGEALRLRLPRPLSGPGSILNQTAPTGATRFNYHMVFVKSIALALPAIVLEVLPAPSYSYPDDEGFSSATWLLRQTPRFLDRHLPLPYRELELSTPPHPTTPTPLAFGAPLDLNGWRDRRPSWIDIDSMHVELRRMTRFKRFNPPVLLKPDEMMRIAQYAEYYRQRYDVKVNTPAQGETDGDCDGIQESPITGPSNKNLAPGSIAPPGNDEITQHIPDTSWKQHHVLRLWEYDDDDGTDDEDDGDDDVDFVGHALLFRPNDLYLAQLIKDRRENEHVKLVQTVSAWAGAIPVNRG